MIVDLFTIEPDGAEHIWCCAVDLYECFPDDMETALVVEAELIERGFTYTGGGAAQRFKVVRCGA